MESMCIYVIIQDIRYISTGGTVREDSTKFLPPSLHMQNKMVWLLIVLSSSWIVIFSLFQWTLIAISTILRWIELSESGIWFSFWVAWGPKISLATSAIQDFTNSSQTLNDFFVVAFRKGSFKVVQWFAFEVTMLRIKIPNKFWRFHSIIGKCLGKHNT